MSKTEDPAKMGCQLIFWIAVLFLMVKCMSCSHEHSSSSTLTASARDDFGEAYPLGVHAGTVAAESGGGIPTAAGLDQIAGMAVTLDGKNAENKDRWFRAWKSGFEQGYQDHSKPAF